MAYVPTWSSADPRGRLTPAHHVVHLADFAELAATINRRRLLTYQAPQDFWGEMFAGAIVRRGPLAARTAPPCDDFRRSLLEDILAAPAGALGGTPPSPAAMQWLWPVADGDENKVLVSGRDPVPNGQVGLLQKINASDHWTDDELLAGRTPIRALHLNELRAAVEFLRRGRWRLPVYWAAGIFSRMPDTPWIGELIANNGQYDLRTIGFTMLRTDESPARGLVNVTVRSGSVLEITADADCRVALYRCLRPIDYLNELPTWNEYAPGQSAAWTSPGGTGEGDSVYIGSADLEAGVAGTVGGSAVAQALQAMIAEPGANFLIRRTDTGPQTIYLSATAVVEFDLATPPN